MSHRTPLVFLLLSWVVALWPAKSQAGGSPTTVLESQQIVAPLADALGDSLAVSGTVAVATSASTGELYTFLFDTTALAWSAGPVIAPTDALQITSVAIEGSQIYYSVVTSQDRAGLFDYEVRVETLFLPGQSATIHTGTGNPPRRLAARGGLVVAGYSPSPLRGVGAYATRAWRLSGTWNSILDETGPGRAVATNGSQVFASDPALGDHGGVVVYTEIAGTWQILETILYDNILQADSVDFGASLAVDGSCLVVGAPGYDIGVVLPPRTNNVGSAHIYRFDALTFSYVPVQIVVSDSALADDHFGDRVAMHGTTLLMAGPNVQRTNGNPQGDASLFRRGSTSCSSDSWRMVHRLRGTDLVFDPAAVASFGHALGMSSEAGVLIADPAGPVGDGDGALYAFAGQVALFADGFETGDTASWSATSP